MKLQVVGVTSGRLALRYAPSHAIPKTSLVAVERITTPRSGIRCAKGCSRKLAHSVEVLWWSADSNDEKRVITS